MPKLSVVLATRNEEKNIGECLSSVKDIAGEIIVVDEESKDKTAEIAKSFGAEVYSVKHSPIFHTSKQKALQLARGDWILQLDADERVSPELAKEIVKILSLSEKEIANYQKNLKNRRLFLRHQKLLEKRDGQIGTNEGLYAGFFVPRLNYFLGKYLRWGGVYPDGVIRLVKRGKARFPAKSVHEQIQVEGKVGWLKNDLIHLADPTFRRYLERNSYYINLLVDEMEREKLPKDIFRLTSYVIVKPICWFFLTQIRHKGILDGVQGVVFSFFSALRFPRAYFRYLKR